MPDARLGIVDTSRARVSHARLPERRRQDERRAEAPRAAKAGDVRPIQARVRVYDVEYAAREDAGSGQIEHVELGELLNLLGDDLLLGPTEQVGVAQKVGFEPLPASDEPENRLHDGTRAWPWRPDRPLRIFSEANR